MNQLRSIFVVLMIVLSYVTANAQSIPDSSAIHSGKLYVIIKNDGTQFVGKLVSMDAREVVTDTKSMGLVSIPKHEIKQIKEADRHDIAKNGEYKSSETFATRYFLTTNGLPIQKGESYILLNWFGPDVEFGIAKNFGIGVMTTWVAIPIIVTAKYSIELDKNTHLALGTLLGSGSWVLPRFGLAVPFGALTWGNRRNNITVSGGYGSVWYDGSSSGRSLFSVAGMTKVSNKISLVFDSFIMPGQVTGENGGNRYTAIYMPGIRLETARERAFQMGFAGIQSEGHFAPVPMVQWFSKF